MSKATRAHGAPPHLAATLALLGDVLREPETRAAYHPDDLIRAQILYQRLRVQLANPGRTGAQSGIRVRNAGEQRGPVSIQQVTKTSDQRPPRPSAAPAR